MKRTILLSLILWCGINLHAQNAQQEPKIEIIFFEKNNPCGTCVAIADITHEVLTKYFAKEQTKGEIVFRQLPYEDTINHALMKKCGVDGESFVILHHKNNGYEVKELFDELAEVAMQRPAQARKILRKKIEAFYR